SELRAHDKETPEKPKKNLLELAVSFFTGEFTRLINEKGGSIAEIKITPENFGEILIYVAEDKISALAAKTVFTEMFRTGEDPSDIIERLGLWQISDTSGLEDIASHIITENPKAVEDYKKGKDASLQFLVGQAMKESRGKANPKIVGDIIRNILSSTQ
ncbi:MAG: Asp-tRNA(Asn)/Glu-tRNA(Gln) amidotransferase subunit GatB, partial [Candidatus Niyogibacteria bacterium]|nr:Asp-tRNA(Asn)/Glu-tRNA(Gln) amidotransferase subunit GatB [Candidatus Niyogibacteria bacterium]